MHTYCNIRCDTNMHLWHIIHQIRCILTYKYQMQYVLTHMILHTPIRTLDVIHTYIHTSDAIHTLDAILTYGYIHTYRSAPFVSLFMSMRPTISVPTWKHRQPDRVDLIHKTIRYDTIQYNMRTIRYNMMTTRYSMIRYDMMRHDMIRHIMTTIRYTMIHNTSMARCNVMRHTPRENRSPYERVWSLRRGNGRLCVVAVIGDHGCRTQAVQHNAVE